MVTSCFSNLKSLLTFSVWCLQTDGSLVLYYHYAWSFLTALFSCELLKNSIFSIAVVLLISIV
jgi:hypothetical protein